MLRIFTSVNPRPWVPEASMLTTRPPKPSYQDFLYFENVSRFYGTRKNVILFADMNSSAAFSAPICGD
jgi:hypothetical protein